MASKDQWTAAKTEVRRACLWALTAVQVDEEDPLKMAVVHQGGMDAGA